MTTRNLAVLLTAYVEKWQAREFDWSAANCCHFGSGWVEVVEGHSPFASFRTFEGERDIRRELREAGSFKLMVTQVARNLGRETIDPRMARLGDIVLVPNEMAQMEMMGICNGRTALILMATGGVGAVAMAEATCAWRIAA